MAQLERDEAAYRARIVEDVRPWGRFRRYPHEDAGSIKIITVDPGGVLSLQYHDRRDEFWVVLDPGLEMTVGDRVWTPAAGEEISSPAGPRTASAIRGPPRPASWRSGLASPTKRTSFASRTITGGNKKDGQSLPESWKGGAAQRPLPPAASRAT